MTSFLFSLVVTVVACRTDGSVCILVPCMPRNIRALVDCQSGTAVLSWQPGGGAMQYTATALSQSGHTLSCESNETSCELADLVCGESYNITVLAQGQTCSSSAVMNGHLTAGTFGQ